MGLAREHSLGFILAAGAVVAASLVLCMPAAASADNVAIKPRTIEITPGSSSAPSTASPYPSSVTMSELTGTTTNVEVVLHGVSDSGIEGLAVLLVGPTGRSIVLMSSYEAGRHRELHDADWHFSESGEAVDCPESKEMTLSGSTATKPFDCGLIAPFPSPAPPADSHQLEELGSNGTWSLYVDNASSDGEGSIAGGWSLAISTGLPLPVNEVNQPEPHGPPGALEEAGYAAHLSFLEQEAREREAERRAKEAQVVQAATRMATKPQCIVPALLGRRIATARRLLSAAHCTLGHVTMPREHRGILRIVGEHPRRGTHLVDGGGVAVRLVEVEHRSR